MIDVASLHYYPVKACRGTDVHTSWVERMGLGGDRRLMLVTPGGRFLTQRDHPRLGLVQPLLKEKRLRLSAPDMPDLHLDLSATGQARTVEIWRSRDVKAVDQGETAARWFSTLLGAQVRLVHIAQGYERRITEKYAFNPDDHTAFADGYPVLLTSEDSLANLNTRLETPIRMSRFRPNLVVRGCEPFSEDNWRRIRLGEVELAVVKPCARCMVTTIDERTLKPSKEPLMTLNSFRKQPGGVMFGQNLIPLSEGHIEIGMKVEVLSWR